MHARVIKALAAHPMVTSVTLVGSRAEGRATSRSDWDFLLETKDPTVLSAALPDLLAALDPVVQQWDRLSTQMCWMALLPGPVKVDVIIAGQPHEPERPWTPSPGNLPAIDAHFWDWVLWLRSKHAKGDSGLVHSELGRLHQHILAPLGLARAPSSIAQAVDDYRYVRDRAERRFGVAVPRHVEAHVAPAVT